jgi:dihydrodipicolinate synthase/N-acetylneuraminate lyase
MADPSTPRPPINGQQLIQFFTEVAAAVDLPVAIQNAPEFLKVGLTTAELLALNERQPNVCIVKAEAPALAVASLVDAVGNKMAVFNGRAGLELTDNYRAGCNGMVPGIETIDLQVKIEKAMAAHDEDRAEELYRQLLPCVTFVMQGLPHLVLYAKIIAAHRLGLAQSSLRNPSDRPTAQGLTWSARLASVLGPLP